MLKTLKSSEKDILFSKGFLLEYFKYSIRNPDTLLMKIFGVYEMQIGSSRPMSFILTENMIGLDSRRIHRCFDLKGSLHGRFTKITDQQLAAGTGLKALKDKNFLMANEISEGGKLLNIDQETKEEILVRLLRDSQFLCKHKLIDYSVFLIQIDRNKIFQKKEAMPFLVYDKEEGRLKFIMKQEETETETETEPGERPRLKSLKKSAMRTAVYKVIENNEVSKSDAFSGLTQRGFADIESTCGNYRFKLGVIDFLTSYDYKKYLENQFKSKINNVDSSEISAIDELCYSKRFVTFMRDHL